MMALLRLQGSINPHSDLYFLYFLLFSNAVFRLISAQSNVSDSEPQRDGRKA